MFCPSPLPTSHLPLAPPGALQIRTRRNGASRPAERRLRAAPGPSPLIVRRRGRRVLPSRPRPDTASHTRSRPDPDSATAETRRSSDSLGSAMAEPSGAAAISAGTASAALTGHPASSASPTGPSVARGRSNRGGKTGNKKSPAVTIMIATTDSEPPQWKIEARVGVRVVLRSGTVSPARVWELVQQLDDETLTRTVGGVLDEQRRSAQARVDALAAELARVRAELDALPDGTPSL